MFTTPHILNWCPGEIVVIKCRGLSDLVVLEGDGLARLGPLEGPMRAVVHLVEPVVGRCKPALCVGGGEVINSPLSL